MKDSRFPYFRQMLMTNQTWAERAIVALYARQTPSECVSARTHEKNGVGFSKTDAPFMSSLAKRINDGHHLTPRQLFYARRTLTKYIGQLIRIADEKRGQIAEREAASPRVIVIQSEDGWTTTTDQNATWFSLVKGYWTIEFRDNRATLKKGNREMISQACADPQAATVLVGLFKTFATANAEEHAESV